MGFVFSIALWLTLAFFSPQPTLAQTIEELNKSIGSTSDQAIQGKLYKQLGDAWVAQDDLDQAAEAYLKALAAGPLHGLGVSRRIAQITRGAFDVGPGSLFPALHRMEEAGWLASSWSESENRRRARFYTLTKAGRRQLEHESRRWGRVSLAISRALETT